MSSDSAKARGRYPLEEFTEIGAGGGFDGARAELVTAKQLRIQLERLAEIGIEYVIAYIPGVAYDHEPLQRFAEDVVPAFG